VIGKALFILFAIVLPLAAIGFASWWLFAAFGGQGACFVIVLLLMYGFAALVVMEAQRHRGKPKSCRRCGATKAKGERACTSCGDPGGFFTFKSGTGDSDGGDGGGGDGGDD
jgi:hypothetical protein